MLNLKTESAATTRNMRHDETDLLILNLRDRRLATGGPRQCEQENGCIEFGTL